MSEITIRQLDIEHDCQKLADLFNESEPAWPGGFTAGLPLTEENVREWMESERTLVTFVAEDGDRLVGYSSLFEGTPWPTGQYDSGYLDLLNVHPDYHGRSVGRRLLQATIERSVQQGWVYQTLGTWSANFKSVPAYKKTGHFWRPDTSVWMQNFIPGALQMPLARRFFDRHDWYSTYVRTLEQRPDDERWEGLKVYRQHWEAEGESLTIWIDREAQGPCAVENGDVLVAAIPSEIEPLQGTSVQMNWRIQNKGSEAIHVHLHAMGADGLKIDHRDAFTVPGGLTVEHVASVQVTDEAPRAKPDGTAPVVRTLIMLDHNEVELFSGLRARAPISVDTCPGTLSLAPGVCTSIALQVHSELETAISATCHVIPSEGLAIDWTEQTVELDPLGHAVLALSATPTIPGVHTLQVRLVPADAAFKPVKEELTLFCVAAGGVLAQAGKESARLETDTVRLTVAARLGTIRITHKDSGLTLFSARPLAGPPYSPSAFDKKHFSLTLANEDGRAAVRMHGEPEHYDDTFMDLTVALSANSLVTVEQQLTCLGTGPYEGRLIMESQWQDNPRLTATTPLNMGHIRAPMSNYPVDADEMPATSEDYAEPWIAVERDGVAGGMAWSAQTERVRHGQWALRLMTAPLSLSRGQRSPVARYALWTGGGDWRAARAALLHWAGQRARTEEVGEPVARGVVQAALPSPVLATVGDSLETVVTVDSASARVMEGVLAVTGGRGLNAEPARFPVEALSRGRAVQVPLRLQVPAEAGCYPVDLDLRLRTMAARSNASVLRLGSPGSVSITEDVRKGQPVRVIDNGRCTLVVAPEYGPSLISWTQAGEEQLHSSFPTPSGHAWAYPWYGGIQLKVFLNDDAESCGNLVHERFTVEDLYSDVDGLPWAGVRLRGRPERKELHDLAVEMDYVTLPQSPLVKAVLRLTNLRATRQEIMIGGGADFSLGGDPARLSLVGDDVWRRPTPWGAWYAGRTWGALTDEASGASLLSVCPQRRLSLSDTGTVGRGFSLSGTVALDGHVSREVTWYFYLAPDMERALSMRELAAL